MQALVLQFGRFGILLLLWFFIWLILHSLKNDTLAASTDPAANPARPTEPEPRRSLKEILRTPRDTVSPKVAHFLMVTQGPLSGARLSLGDQPILLGRADDSTLVLNDDYASGHHARFLPRGDDWYLEDLGSTNGTFLNHDRVTTAVKVPLGTPIRVGKTVIELRP